MYLLGIDIGTGGSRALLIDEQGQVRFGFTAAQVLEYAQALYETHKLISYPRTESRHIGEDLLPQLPGILEHVDHPLAAEAGAEETQQEGGVVMDAAQIEEKITPRTKAILPVEVFGNMAHFDEYARIAEAHVFMEDFATALAMIQAGATRIGAGAGVDIVTSAPSMA